MAQYEVGCVLISAKAIPMTRSSAPDESTVSLFQQHWRVYRILVEENFLFHREV